MAGAGPPSQCLATLTTSACRSSMKVILCKCCRWKVITRTRLGRKCEAALQLELRGCTHSPTEQFLRALRPVHVPVLAPALLVHSPIPGSASTVLALHCHLLLLVAWCLETR